MKWKEKLKNKKHFTSLRVWERQRWSAAAAAAPSSLGNTLNLVRSVTFSHRYQHWHLLAGANKHFSPVTLSGCVLIWEEAQSLWNIATDSSFHTAVKTLWLFICPQSEINRPEGVLIRIFRSAPSLTRFSYLGISVSALITGRGTFIHQFPFFESFLFWYMIKELLWYLKKGHLLC